MKVKFGTFKAPQGPQIPVEWDSEKVLSGHFCLVGPSGSGKTTRLKRFMAGTNLVDPGIRFIVLDPHGDMAVEGFESAVRFSETADFGLNPLKVSADPDYGGPRKRIRSFITMINRTSRVLGSKQEHVVQALLTDLYERAGFLVDDPATWSLEFDPRPPEGRNRKRYPTVTDLRKYTEHKLTQLFLGTSKRTVVALEELYAKIRLLDRCYRSEEKGQKPPADIDKLKTRITELFLEHLNGIETGRELKDLMSYGNKDVLQSVYERISNLENSGIFKPTAPPFSRNCAIWRYDISPLNSDEQRMVVDTVLEELFAEARETGEKPVTETFIVLDEAHKFVSADDDHVINRISREARKFGLGIILSSQNLGDFPDDVLAQIATKWVLGVDATFLDATARKLKIESRRLAGINIHKTSVIQIKHKGETGSHWMDMELV